MIVYRSQERNVQTADAIAEIATLIRKGTQEPLHDLLIRFGELEAAVVDAITPGPDRETAESSAFRLAATALGRLFYRSQARQSISTQPFLKLFDQIRTLRLPRQIRVSIPEGYAFYALYPETYIEASRRFVEECHPKDVCVIGIRSIGASLSAVVAGTLEELGCATRSFTVRPQGHPFNRRLNLATPFPGASQFYAVVDEGPGLSGSSFGCVANALPRDRVVLFPSWAGDANRLLNDLARQTWASYRKYYGCFEAASICGDEPFLDLSGGQWRGEENDIAVHPQHEACKYLAGLTLHKFAGLGAYGRARFDRARILGEAGYAPPAIALEKGFLAFEFMARIPKCPRDPDVTERIAEYLAFRSQTFPAERSVSFDNIREMIAVNTSANVNLEAYRREVADRPAVAIDGRMMPHEWIGTMNGWMKTDSVDHCCNHFFPGCADIAWDLAGAAVEFQMTPDGREHLLQRYRCHLRRLHFASPHALLRNRISCVPARLCHHGQGSYGGNSGPPTL